MLELSKSKGSSGLFSRMKALEARFFFDFWSLKISEEKSTHMI
jgi:hypothetical protein